MSGIKFATGWSFLYLVSDGTPTNEDVGSHSGVKVTDTGGASDTKTFTLTQHQRRACNSWLGL